MEHAKRATWPNSAPEVVTPAAVTGPLAATMADQKVAHALWIAGLDKQAQTGLLSSSPGPDLCKVPPPPDPLPVPGA